MSCLLLLSSPVIVSALLETRHVNTKAGHLTMSSKTSNNIYQKQARMIYLVFPQEYIYITREYASFMR